MEQTLFFRENGTFTIAQFTDIHWQDGGQNDQKSLRLMEQVVEQEKPDLVVYTGDIIYTGNDRQGKRKCTNPNQAFCDVVSVAESREIPWGFVFGNHDTENGITREQLMDTALQHKYCIADHGPPNVSGVGNYVLKIKDQQGQNVAVLYFFDSGEYSPLQQVSGYNWIRSDQIRWFKEQIALQKYINKRETLPSLAFLHIPLPEYQDVWEKVICYGNKFEEVCSPQLNSGLFTAMVETQGMMGVFCGHDHINDFWGELHGIRLCYGRASGYNTYGKKGFPRGARIIRLTAGLNQFETWLRLDNGLVVREQNKHLPPERDTQFPL